MGTGLTYFLLGLGLLRLEIDPWKWEMKFSIARNLIVLVEAEIKHEALNKKFIFEQFFFWNDY